MARVDVYVNSEQRPDSAEVQPNASKEASRPRVEPESDPHYFRREEALTINGQALASIRGRAHRRWRLD